MEEKDLKGRTHTSKGILNAFDRRGESGLLDPYLISEFYWLGDNIL